MRFPPSIAAVAAHLLAPDSAVLPLRHRSHFLVRRHRRSSLRGCDSQSTAAELVVKS